MLFAKFFCDLIPLKIVFDADNVIFAGVFADLNFDDDERKFAIILQTVNFAHFNISGFIRTHVKNFITHGASRRSADNDPMFRTVQMLLERKAFARSYHNALNLVTFIVVQNRIRSPRTRNGLRHIGERRMLSLQRFDNFLYLLTRRKRCDEESIRRIDDEHFIQINCSD